MPETLHLTDEQLELYALGRLPESDAAIVEEHLLLCASCQERLDEAELFAVAMRQAISAEPAEEPRWNWLQWLKTSWATPWSFAAPAVFAALVLASVLYLHPGRNVPPLASVDLAAMRGDMPQVSPAQETILTLKDAPTQPGLHVQVVDYKGLTVWNAQPVAARVRVAKQLAPGTYFVRLFDQSGKLLHEYGFSVQTPPL